MEKIRLLRQLLIKNNNGSILVHMDLTYCRSLLELLVSAGEDEEDTVSLDKSEVTHLIEELTAMRDKMT